MQPAGHDRPSLVTPLITAAVLLLPPLAGCSFSRKPERWLPFVLGFAVFMLAPRYVFSTAYFFQRLGVFLVPLWLMTWDPPRGAGRRLDWVAIGSRAAVVVHDDRTLRGVRARDGEFPRRRGAACRRVSRVARWSTATPVRTFALPVYMHFPAWYAATGRGIVDFNFADFISQMVRYRKDAGPRITEELAWYPDRSSTGASTAASATTTSS